MSEEKDEAKEKTAEDEKIAEKQDPSADISVETQNDKTEKADSKEKPLEKMTVKDLREIAKEVPGITGVHGMKKEELIVALKEAKGIKDEPAKKSTGKPKVKTVVSVRELKTVIKQLKVKREQAIADSDRKMAKIYRRRISRLKKKTRQAA